jgi:membrane fusion protein (multidrug efflux system)
VIALAMAGRRRSVAGAVLVSVALCACGGSAPGSSTLTAPPGVRIVHPVRGQIARSVTLPAFRILPLQEATLYAKVSGYLKTLTVDKGDAVEAGQLLAEIEVPELLADETQLEAEEQVARTDYDRMVRAREKAADLVVPQTVDDSRGRWEVARAKLERTRTLLGYARLTAPFAGIVTARFVDPGAFIPAATSGTPAQSAALVTLMDASRVRVQVYVPEAEVPRIKRELPVRLTLEELPGRTFAGTVTRFAYALDEATKSMLAEIEIPNPGGELRPGMYASVQLEVERRDDALLVPRSAVLREKVGSFVLRVVDGKVAKTAVQTGFVDGVNVEVVSGVDPGQAVILAADQAPGDGQPVTVVEQR